MGFKSFDWQTLTAHHHGNSQSQEKRSGIENRAKISEFMKDSQKDGTTQLSKRWLAGGDVGPQPYTLGK